MHAVMQIVTCHGAAETRLKKLPLQTPELPALAAKDAALAKQACTIAELHQQLSSLPVPLTVATAAGTKSTTMSAGLLHLSLHAPADAAQSLASSDMCATIPRNRKFMVVFTMI